MRNRAPSIALSILATAAVLAARAPGPVPQSRPRPAAVVLTPWPSAIALVRFGLFSPSAGIFKTVYGRGAVFGGEFRLHAKGGFYLSLAGESFKKTGKLTVTRERTTISILPVDVMAVFHALSGPVMPYAGIGGSACKYTEENIIGKVGKWGLGFAACGGVTVRRRSLGLDARLKYGSVKVKPFEERVDLGGLTLSVAAAYAF
jgi:hypothetical protein